MLKLSSLTDLKSFRENLIRQYDGTKKRLRICSTGCRARGALKIRDAFHKEIKTRRLGSEIEIMETGCQGLCAYAPVVSIDPAGIFYGKLTENDIPAVISKTIRNGRVLNKLCYSQNGTVYPYLNDIPFFRSQKKIVLRNCGYIRPTSIDDYISRNGYAAIAKILSGMKPEQVIDEVTKSGIRGRGGAGFPTGLKWKFANGYQSDTKYFICNGDEGDPGAFMDRAVLEGDPLSVIEGMMIGAYAIGASHGYIYVRAEYPIAVEYSTLAVKQAHEAGLLGENILGTGFNFDITIKQGAGAFVCGEETALIGSIEGKRGMPKPRPPFPAEAGLWGKPTVINNVETLASIPQIILEGGAEYAKIGTAGSKGTKVFALAGKVTNTGLVEVPMGMTLRQIIFDIGGGITRGREFKAVQMGGPSGGCLPAEYLDTPIDYESIKEAGAIMGSGGMIVLDEANCMVDIARYFLDFVQKESCGKCLPCRLGTKRMLEIVTRFTEGKAQSGDIEKLQKLAESVRDTSLCGLGQTAPNPVLSTIRYFRDEYETHLLEKYCPSSACSVIVKSPCQNACPAHINVPQYNALIREKQYLRALNLIRRSVPFPASLGRVCFRPCETVCRRGEIDSPIAINHLKRYISDKSPLSRGVRGVLFPFNAPEIFDPNKKDKSVAIIGGGPAGLSAAYFLRIMGREVTVFEKEREAGGLLRYGIPSYRLPKNIVQDEINLLKAMGIKIKTNSPVKTRSQWEGISKDYDAVFIAIGSGKSRSLGVPGEDTKAVVDALQFLNEVVAGKVKKVPSRVAVIGGGNSAIDSARSALRLGAKEVTVVYRRSRAEMPAHKDEIADALAEGVKFRFLAAPVKVAPAGIECIEMQLGPADKDLGELGRANGRRKPVPVKGSEFTIATDMIITAISQSPDLEFLGTNLELAKWGGLRVNPVTMETSLKGIFAGGDTITNAGMVIYAIATGQKAAVAIDKYLGGEGKLPENIDPMLTHTTDLKGPPEPLKAERQPIQHIPLKARCHNFKEVIKGYTDYAAYQEASRCLRCDLENKEYQPQTCLPAGPPA